MNKLLIFSVVFTLFFITNDVQAQIYNSGNTVGPFSSAIGRANVVPGNFSLGIGENTNVSGTYSIAGGFDVDVTGSYSLALGTRNRSTNSHTVTVGIDLQATANRSMVLGSGVTQNPGIGTDLVNSVPSSLMVGFNSDLPTLFVGGASGIGTTGKVGIGTSTPNVDLHVKGFSLIDGQNASLLLGGTTGATYGEWGIEYNSGGLNFWKPFGSNMGLKNFRLFIADNGNVSVGTNDSEGYKFAVKGDMIAEKVVVKLHANWPDFVFTEEYGLMPLSEVEAFIKEHSHLPNVPSAKEVEKGGVNLGEMDRVLLQKVEELTLYIIELEKQIEAMKNK